MLPPMRAEIDEVLDCLGGVASRSELVRRVGRTAFDDEVRRGLLTAIFPRAYARPWDADLPGHRLTAALASVGGEVALSHVTALDQWGLPIREAHPIHVTAYNPRHPRGVRGELVVHRTLAPLNAFEVNGRAVVRPEVAAITSWPLLNDPDRRAPLIEGARRGVIRPSELLRQAESMWWIKSRRSLQELVALLAAGCESELELWGYLDVFNVPGLSDATRQLRLTVGGKTYRLDMAYEAERLAIELDGREFHASADRWERDIARDLALATIDWQTIRLPHRRLHNDVPGCRRDVLAVRAVRGRRRAS
jgi:very-short-patch-repair endonuclease